MEKVDNFRDLGAYLTKDGGRTRPGLIYRSGALSKLSENDRATLRRLNIGTVFDLRLGWEQNFEGAYELGEAIEVIHVPTTLIPGDMLAEVKRKGEKLRMLDYYIESMAPRIGYHADLFKQMLARLDRPLVFHCSAGKDRTGIVAALLLRVAGVADADIIADYAKTAQHIGHSLEGRLPMIRSYGLTQPVIDELFGSPPERMAAFLAYLDETFGSAAAYLKQGGVSSAELERFRALFVDSSP